MPAQAVTVLQNGTGAATFNTAGVTSYVIGQPVTFTGGTTFNPLPIQASVTTIALLRSYTVAPPIVNGSAIQVTGYYAANDGGGGLYVWNSTSTAADNGGTVIQATGVATGRWLLKVTEPISVRQFGAKGDGVTDDSVAINNCAAAAAGNGFLVPNGTFATSTYILVPANTKMEGLPGGSIKALGNMPNYSGFGSADQHQTVILNGDNAQAEGLVINCNGFQAGGFCASGTSGNNVIRCAVIGSSAASPAQAVFFTSASQAVVGDNYFYRVLHGVELWTCSSIIVRNNIVNETTAGLWNALGNNITYIGNQVSNCADVGIDVEGGMHMLISGNQIQSCNNGELAVFPDGVNAAPGTVISDILFSGNAVFRTQTYLDITGTPQATNTTQGAIRIGSLNAQNHVGIVFKGNRLYADNRNLIFQEDPVSLTTTTGLVIEDNVGYQTGASSIFVRCKGSGIIFRRNAFQNVTANNLGENQFVDASGLQCEDNIFKFASKSSGYAFLWFTDTAGITTGVFSNNRVLGASQYGFKHDPYVSGTSAILYNNDFSGGEYAIDGGVLTTANGYPILRRQTLLVQLPSQPLDTPSTISWDLLTIGGGILKHYYVTADATLCLSYGNVMRTYYDGLSCYFEGTGGALSSPSAGISRSGSVAAATFSGTTVTISTSATGASMGALLKITADEMVF